MARTKRHCASTGGRANQRARTAEKACKMGKSLVRAHLEGFIGRKRVHAYEKARLKQDLQSCLDSNQETLMKRMHQGEETVEFCFGHNYYEYRPQQEEVREALPAELKELVEGVVWAKTGQTPFTLTVTGACEGQQGRVDWVIGIAVESGYLKEARDAALARLDGFDDARDS
jgi:hypothetical protein